MTTLTAQEIAAIRGHVTDAIHGFARGESAVRVVDEATASILAHLRSQEPRGMTLTEEERAIVETAERWSGDVASTALVAQLKCIIDRLQSQEAGER